MNFLTTEEMNALALQAKTGDAKAKLELYNQCKLFIIHHSKKFRNKGIPIEDLLSEGVCGLYKAVELYNPSKGPSFLGYSKFWIKQAMYQAIYSESSLVRIPTSQRNMIFKVFKAQREYVTKYKDEPTLAKLSEITGFSQSKIEKLLSLNKKDLSMDAHLSGDSENCTFGDFFANDDDIADEAMAKQDSIRELPKLLDKLPNRERDILIMYFGIGMEAIERTKICRMFGFGSERLRQLKERACNILRRRYPEKLKILMNGFQKN